MPRLLIITAVPAEREAVLGKRTTVPAELAGQPELRCQTPAGLLDLACGGVGPVAAALSTAALLADPAVRYDLVIATGIAGGFPAAPIGGLVVADAVIQADLGAETADGGFSSLAELGMGPVRLQLDPALVARLAERSSAAVGAVLTVATVTGTAGRAARLLASYPDALAEGMEGAGVGLAAARAGVPFAEIRAISNLVGPRNRQAWQLGPALAGLGRAFDQLLDQPLLEPSP
jgi:futalosine hydrolase